METKSIFKSKTFWVNLITFLIGAGALIEPTWLTALGLKPEYLIEIGAILNIALRYVSKDPVSITGS